MNRDGIVPIALKCAHALVSAGIAAWLTYAQIAGQLDLYEVVECPATSVAPYVFDNAWAYLLLMLPVVLSLAPYDYNMRGYAFAAAACDVLLAAVALAAGMATGVVAAAGVGAALLVAAALAALTGMTRRPDAEA